MDHRSIPFLLCYQFLFVNKSVDQKHSYNAYTEDGELIPCIPAYGVMVNKDRTLSKVYEYTQFSKQIHQLAANGYCCYKIQNRRA